MSISRLRLLALATIAAAGAGLVYATPALPVPTSATSLSEVSPRPLPPPFAAPRPGILYHGVHPSGLDGDETFPRPRLLKEYENAVGARAAWVYFSQEWSQQRAFPTAKARSLSSAGALPVMRLMLRSAAAVNGRQGRDPEYSLDQILRGTFDGDLRAWADGARAHRAPILLELGTEVNGDWFGWNGRWNGGATKSGYGSPAHFDGPERFQQAFRRVVDLVRSQGARNVGFVFHVDAQDSPAGPSNRMELYYPGDRYVDLIGISAYGSQSPMDDYLPPTFRALVDRAYARLHRLAPRKPVAVLEFGSARNGRVDPAAYARGALTDLLGRRWPQVVGFAWWNEGWPNDDNPQHNTTMRLQEQPKVAAIFRSRVAASKSLKTSYP